jgi:hypothetical protein
MADWNLVVPFLTDDPMFAYGVELGMLFMRMKEGEPIGDYFTRQNQERILLLANRLRWSVKNLDTPRSIVGRDWFWCELEPPGA